MGVLSLRDVNFRFDGSKRYQDAQKDMNKLLSNVITNSAEFNFRMEDIKRLRKEFATLIDNLSDMYREKEAEKRRLKSHRLGITTKNKGGYEV